MRKFSAIIIVCFGVAFSSCKSDSKKQEHNHTTEIAKKEYMCPMNCEKDKTYKEEGKCPVCKMKLVDKEKLKKED